MKRRKDTETTLGADKREVLEILRGDTLLQKVHEIWVNNNPRLRSTMGIWHIAQAASDVNVTHGLVISNIISEGNDQSSRATSELIQELNQNLQKLDEKIHLHDNNNKIETLLKELAVSVKLIDCTLERWKCVENVYRTGIQKNLGSMRRAAHTPP